MKRIIIVFLFFVSVCNAQSPYLDSTSHWEEESQYSAIFVNDSAHFENYTYSLPDDSIINGKLYFQLYRNGYDSAVSYQNGGWSFNLITNELVGFLREDSSIKRFYFIAAFTTYENVLYDFSLNVGDTLPYSYGFPNCSAGNINSIDTVLFSGIRKRFFPAAVCHLGVVKITEGIGANGGLLGNMCMSWDGVYTCMKGFYNSTDTIVFNYCSLSTNMSSPQDKENIFVKIYPNPFTDYVNIIIGDEIIKDVYSNDFFEIIVTDKFGVKKLQRAVTRKELPQLKLNLNYAPGIYFLSINSQTIKKTIKLVNL